MSTDRTGFIGGSDAPAILGLAPWTTALRLWQAKTGREPDALPVDVQARLRRGRILEPAVRELALEALRDHAEAKGAARTSVSWLATNQRHTHPHWPHLSAEVDAEMEWFDKHVIVELKTVSPHAAHLWGEEGTDQVPDYYLIQVQHQMMVTGLSTAVVVALIGFDDLRLHVVQADPELQHHLLDAEHEFWRCVQTDTPPAPVSLEDVQRLYRRSAPVTLEVTEQTVALCREMAHERALVAEHQARADKAELVLKNLMGEAEAIAHDGRVLATWKASKPSRAIDYRQLVAYLRPEPEVVERFSYDKPGTRRFLLKPLADEVRDD